MSCELVSQSFLFQLDWSIDSNPQFLYSGIVSVVLLTIDLSAANRSDNCKPNQNYYLDILLFLMLEHNWFRNCFLSTSPQGSGNVDQAFRICLENPPAFRYLHFLFWICKMQLRPDKLKMYNKNPPQSAFASAWSELNVCVDRGLSRNLWWRCPGCHQPCQIRYLRTRE